MEQEQHNNIPLAESKSLKKKYMFNCGGGKFVTAHDHRKVKNQGNNELETGLLSDMGRKQPTEVHGKPYNQDISIAQMSQISIPYNVMHYNINTFI